LVSYHTSLLGTTVRSTGVASTSQDCSCAMLRVQNLNVWSWCGFRYHNLHTEHRKNWSKGEHIHTHTHTHTAWWSLWPTCFL